MEALPETTWIDEAGDGNAGRGPRFAESGTGTKREQLATSCRMNSRPATMRCKRQKLHSIKHWVITQPQFG